MVMRSALREGNGWGGKKETITKGERSVHEEKNEKWEETRGVLSVIYRHRLLVV